MLAYVFGLCSTQMHVISHHVWENISGTLGKIPNSKADILSTSLPSEQGIWFEMLRLELI